MNRRVPRSFAGIRCHAVLLPGCETKLSNAKQHDREDSGNNSKLHHRGAMVVPTTFADGAQLRGVQA